MFDNIGKKIKNLAKFVCWTGIGCSVIVGLVFWVLGVAKNAGAIVFFEGLGIAIGGSLASWIGSFATYALGELAENSQLSLVELRKQTNALQEMNQILRKLDSEESEDESD